MYNTKVIFTFGVILGGLVTLVVGLALFVPSVRSIAKEIGPVLAVPGVFGAALLAFAASVAKVEFDEKLDKRNRENMLDALYTRLYFAIGKLGFDFERNAKFFDKLSKDPPFSFGRNVLEEVRITIPTEIDEAWKRADILPPKIRKNLYVVIGMTQEYLSLRNWYPDLNKINPTEIDQRWFTSLREQAKAFDPEISAIYEELKPYVVDGKR